MGDHQTHRSDGLVSIQDTIAAIATAPGVGGVGIVRISGSSSLEILKTLSGLSQVQARHAHYAAFLSADNIAIDHGLALYFKGPASFTGEDIVELQAHGGPVVLNMLLNRVIELGARMARPGEFSERAFLNNKIDLAQAEAVADLIEAASESAVMAANRSLEGEFSKAVMELQQSLIKMRIWVEAALDFPEEEIDFLSDPELAGMSRKLNSDLNDLMARAQEGHCLRDGFSVVIIGPPNAGKSSLLNTLAGRETAIVSDIPGTTRDLVREQILVKGMPIHVIDTAGLREAGDRIEQIGIHRAVAEANKAQCLLIVSDASSEQSANIPDELSSLPKIHIYNKIDLLDDPVKKAGEDEGSVLYLSAKTGQGIELLRDRLYQLAAGGHHEGVFTARQRHLDALKEVGQHFSIGLHLLEQGDGELVAEELKSAQKALSRITGEFTTDDLLGEIFSGFCIGK